MKILAKTKKVFKNGSTYFLSVNNEIETIVEYVGTDDNNNKMFEAPIQFEEKVENFKCVPGKTFVFIQKTDVDFMKGIITLKMSDIEFIFSED